MDGLVIDSFAGGGGAPNEGFRGAGIDDPLPTQTTENRFGLVTPCIVPVTHAGDDRSAPIDEPLRTVTAAHRGEHAVVAPFLVPRYGERPGQEPRCQPVDAPLSTVVPTANGAQLVSAFLAQHNTGMTGHDAREPVSTIVGKGCTQAVVAAHILNMKGSDRAASAIEAPIPTICGSATHAYLVAAFMQKYYGDGGQDQPAGEPLHTVTSKDRFGLVTVTIAGAEYGVVDIGMRMLTPRELFRAQGFGDEYIIDPIYAGKPLTRTAQVRMCGNSVSPPVVRALVEANLAAGAERRVVG